MNNNNKNYKYNNFNSFKEHLKDIKKLYIKNIKIIFLNLHNKTNCSTIYSNFKFNHVYMKTQKWNINFLLIIINLISSNIYFNLNRIVMFYKKKKISDLNIQKKISFHLLSKKISLIFIISFDFKLLQ